MNPLFRFPTVAVLGLLAAAVVAPAQQLTVQPFHASGIYRAGESVGWTLSLPAGVKAPAGGYDYTVKRDGAVVIKSGKIDPAPSATIELSVNEPAMVLLDVAPMDRAAKHTVAGAAIDPTRIPPDAACPADFDAFWASKIALLHGIPMDPVVTPEPSGRDGVDYATVRLNNIGGAHVYGQLAKPSRPGKFPAVLIMQWAGGPYPLQKAWVTDRAAQGWLALNVEPHDVPFNLPKEFYDALPAMIKNYTSLYNDERDRNYFLQMYLGDYRALDYLAGRPDWDGRILVAAGTSMGGQQSFAVAGLHPRVTHMIVDVPAGADSNAALHGRAAGYPNWDARSPKVMSTALYFDTVNFASRIKAKCLVAMGFVDTTCPPVGVWTAFNQIAGPKEAVPMIDSPHNNFATPEEQRPYTERSAAWFAALVQDREPELRNNLGEAK
ncbi:MAG TPA: acetylxylan esterase [Opitutaceae bacterium]|nr:acetylxylan esterase [Opitutaceae bacterium]